MTSGAADRLGLLAKRRVLAVTAGGAHRLWYSSARSYAGAHAAASAWPRCRQTANATEKPTTNRERRQVQPVEHAVSGGPRAGAISQCTST